jgi:hypothetical protein
MTNFFGAHRVPFFLLVAVGLAACETEPSITAPTPPPAATPGISISVTNPSPVTVLPIPVGAQISIALTRTGGFSGAVTLVAEGLPSGWSASFAPAQITSGAGTLATVVVPANAPRGNVVVTFRATAPGVTAATSQATITLQ